jgi:3-oxoacyl-[acyl-carrier protein] reductase
VSILSDPQADPSDAFRLTGRVAVVTGAAGGIGREAARLFARAGADVVVADRDEAQLEVTSKEVRAAAPGARVLVVPTDVSQKHQIDGLAERALAEFSRLDVWANVAGILRHGPMVDTTEEGLDAVVGVNLKGVYWGTAAAGRIMMAAGRGSIVNIASAGGDMPTPNISVYGLTKAAVIHLTKTAAWEFGSSGVRVNAIAPGFIDTPMVAVHWTDASGHTDEDKRRSMLETRAAQAPLGVTGEPADIAYAMLYLASDASRFVTGQVIRPNGGVVMP